MQVLYGKLPYKSSSFDNLLKELNPNFEVKFPEEPKVSEGVKEIIKKCLIVEEEGRADWDFLFEHPVFKDEVPSISNLKKRLKYILGRIRREIR